MTDKEKYVKLFTKFLSKKNSENMINHIYNYCNEYAENNNCLFLIDDIINTKISFFQELFQKNNFLKDAIKNKDIDENGICYLSADVLEPEKYKTILEKRELEDYRKNNQVTSDAYKCKKCGERRCQVTQKQTRSGDEPATTFVECMECGYMFKF